VNGAPSTGPCQAAASVDRNAPVALKIALFRSLFRGRQDVHARRFESRSTGRSGYAPACANEWVEGICRKPRIACADCVHQRFLPLTDALLYRHLSGHEASLDERPASAEPGAVRNGPPLRQPYVAGLYPLLADDTEFHRAQALRLSTWGKPRVISCATDHPRHLALPRGCLEDVQRTLRDLGVQVSMRDERCSGAATVLTFQGQLRPDQQEAARKLLAHDTGVLAASTGFGKTVVAAWLIAQRGVSTLVLVHRRQLQEQWVEQLSGWLGLPASSIGRIGGGHRRATGRIDVALVQSLVRQGEADEWVTRYGQLVVDECHHLAAAGFEQVARRTRARYVLGLSATVERRNGHHPIVFMQCGPVRHRVQARAQAAIRPFEHRVVIQPTGFRAATDGSADPRAGFQALYCALVADEERNRRICEDIVRCAGEGRSALVLTERIEHLERLRERLAPAVQNLVVLRAGLGRRRERAQQEQLAAAAAAPGRVLLATGRHIGEGFDDPRLDTLFLTLPVSWRGTIAQYAGRLHRLCDGKREVRIHDYADLHVPMLARMFERRCRGYESLGYTVMLPASAAAGWPLDVVLPADAGWTRRHAEPCAGCWPTAWTRRWRSCSCRPRIRFRRMRKAPAAPAAQAKPSSGSGCRRCRAPAGASA
jgi:superfamily II DNA or RNA helicase